MRARTILAAAFLAGTSIACSKPASDISQDQDTGTPSREINLVPEPSPGAPVVSPLEAGEPASLAIERAPSSGGERSTARVASVQPAEPAPRTDDARPAITLTEMATPATVVAPNTGLPVAVSRLAPAVALGENEVRRRTVATPHRPPGHADR